MALFFAIIPDEELRGRFRKAIGEKERRSLEKEGIKWTDDDNLHLTLLHLGDVPASVVNALINAANREFRDKQKLEVDVLKPVDHTERKGRRVIYAPCRPKTVFSELLDACRQAGKAVHLKLDPLPFEAHITLGKTDGERCRDWPPPKGERIGTLKVCKVTLMESKGRNYNKIGVFDLLAEAQNQTSG